MQKYRISLIVAGSLIVGCVSAFLVMLAYIKFTVSSVGSGISQMAGGISNWSYKDVRGKPTFYNSSNVTITAACNGDNGKSVNADGINEVIAIPKSVLGLKYNDHIVNVQYSSLVNYDYQIDVKPQNAFTKYGISGNIQPLALSQGMSNSYLYFKSKNFFDSLKQSQQIIIQVTTDKLLFNKHYGRIKGNLLSGTELGHANDYCASVAAKVEVEKQKQITEKKAVEEKAKPKPKPIIKPRMGIVTYYNDDGTTYDVYEEMDR